MKKKILTGVFLAMALTFGMSQAYAQQQSPSTAPGSPPYMMCPMMSQGSMGHGQMGQGTGMAMMPHCRMMMQGTQGVAHTGHGTSTPTLAGN